MDDWVVTVKDELQRMDISRTVEKQHWDKRSIFRVPESVRDLNVKAYKPQTVSFGPYHHGEYHLTRMEEHKHRALLHFLKRSHKPLESYVNSLAEVVQILKDSYDSLDLVWERDTDRFLQLMILDGCFMLEVLRNNSQTADQKNTQTVNDYVANDPIFSNHGKLHIVPYIKRDMLMLENQLPMLLLTTLLDEETKQDEEFLNKYILQFFPCNIRNSSDLRMDKCLHLLDAHRKILLWKDSRNLTGRRRKSWCRWNILSCLMGHEASAGDEIIRSAMEINEAGISFKKSKSRSLQDISFEGGELCLPPIVVDDTTESMFLNIIAFERFHIGVGNKVTSYIFFMDSIIDSAKDVSLLHDKGIIQNALGSDKAVAQLFNNISKDATLDPASSLKRVHERVVKYCRQPWNKWRAVLSHTYFAFLATKPWAIISVSAALLLYAFTILQTVYTVLSYYKPNDSSSPSMP
ncbi:hypothetical protein RHGRI_034397 [Rhododendron griersonianum]|uniref:Uncharacterized protein n=1 Tax=Rhododendron griersonianum TaxID=479676 RepID=A0AAV6I632_9ERIC|nr:hypothetical protein RHGRI_034397 [Rhododendron griersonianum]